MIPRVELVYDRDCPNLAEARRVLLEAFAKANVQATWGEWDRSAPESPSFVRGYGSPTILVDRKDVASAQAGEGADCCRLYDHELGGLRGVPSVERVAAALRCGQRTWEVTRMAAKRKVELFSAGCPACEETIQLVNRIACPSCEVTVLDMKDSSIASRAKSLGIRSVPAVVINSKLADCCAGRGLDEATLRTAGVGHAI